MKRIELTDEQIETVVQLRQGRRYSWLRIQKETGISRHVAKREYLRWEDNQGKKKLETVRREVAAQEFQRHLDALVETAMQFAALLVSPEPLETRTASEFLESNIRELGSHRDIHEEPSILEGMSARQRKWMVESLRAHTLESVPWDKLKDWARQWDRCVEEYQICWSMIHLQPVCDTLPDAEEQGINDLKDHLWSTLWINMRMPEPKTSIEELSCDAANRWGRIVADDSRMAMIVAVSARELQTIFASDHFLYALTAEGKLRQAATNLDERLDPLRLKAVLIRTRCDLCPA